MKFKALLVAAVFTAGLGASFALASPADEGGRGKGKKNSGAASTATHTTGTTTTGSARCRVVQLRGTTPGGTFTMKVEKANKHARDLENATIEFSGGVRVTGRLCATAGQTAGTVELKVLQVRKDHGGDDD